MVNTQIENKPGDNKKAWSKPRLYFGKAIGFLGLGHVQSSTGPYGTPS